MHDHVKAKVEGFAIDLVNGTVDLGWPRCLWRDYPRESPRRDRPERLLMERKLKRGAPAAPSLPDSGAIRVKSYWAGIARPGLNPAP